MANKLIALSMAGLLATACTTTGNIENNAAKGAVIGAVAGAVIGNNVGDGDAKDGAVAGAVVGAAAGAYKGRQEDIRSGEGTRLKERADGQELYYDDQYERYYYFDERTGRTYWQDGSLRG
ncbi:MAG: YMGG-like glycine zipper-containing protein [bacterium]